MPATVLTPIVCPNGFFTVGVPITLTALDNANGNSFISTGHEVLFIQNSDGAAPHVVTVTAGPDREGRAQNLTISLPLSTYYITQLFPTYGWGVGGVITLPSGQNAQLLVAVLQFPF